MVSAPPPRLDVLTRRVRWLERYRRPLSVTIAMGAWLLLSRELAAMFNSDWPAVLPMVAAALFGTAAWWLLEVAFAAALAMWETEADTIARDRGLPRARLVKRR